MRTCGSEISFFMPKSWNGSGPLRGLYITKNNHIQSEVNVSNIEPGKFRLVSGLCKTLRLLYFATYVPLEVISLCQCTAEGLDRHSLQTYPVEMIFWMREIRKLLAADRAARMYEYNRKNRMDFTNVNLSCVISWLEDQSVICTNFGAFHVSVHTFCSESDRIVIGCFQRLLCED